jgi:hypothetical protein
MNMRFNGWPIALQCIFLFLSQSVVINGSINGAENCDLDCLNNGYCTYILEDNGELARHVQSGSLVEECICPSGYGGLACDYRVQQCSLPDRVCHNGVPCAQSKISGTWMCDCTIADRVSAFAGKMCRDPYTEYCSGRFDPDSSLTFCTNGGKCKSTLMGAQVGPENVSTNTAYQHLGCTCNDAFYGPHCEFLRYGPEHSQDGPIENLRAEPIVTKRMSISVFFVASFLALAFGIAVFLQRRRRHRERVFGNARTPSCAGEVMDEGHFVMPGGDEDGHAMT